MRRSSATTRLIVKTVRVLHMTVDMLSEPDRGVAMRSAGTADRRVDLWRTREASSRLDFVRVPLRFVHDTNSMMMSSAKR